MASTKYNEKKIFTFASCIFLIPFDDDHYLSRWKTNAPSNNLLQAPYEMQYIGRAVNTNDEVSSCHAVENCFVNVDGTYVIDNPIKLRLVASDLSYQ